MKEKLQALSDTQLFDVVKYYKRYGYTEQMREDALNILLNERGYDMDYLKIHDYLSNDVQESALSYFKQYKKKNVIALCCYFAVPLFSIISRLVEMDFFAVLGIIAFLVFIYEVVSSFFLLKRCYDLMPGKECPISPELYFSLGIILYFVIFFYSNTEIENDINEIS